MNTTPASFQKSLMRAFIVLLVIVAILAAFFSFLDKTPRLSGSVSLSQMLVDAQQGKIAQIEIQPKDSRDLLVVYKNQPRNSYYTRIDSDEGIIKLLTTANVPLNTIDVHVAPTPAWDGPMNSLAILLPLIIMTVVFIFIFRLQRAQRQRQASQEKSS